jgi:anti-sigma regulatory factor (Ser/Thr protein kinase)
MSQIIISIPNKISLIPIVIQGVSTYAKIVGFPETDCMHLELVIEELLTNVIKYDYMPDQTETIEIVLNTTTLGVRIHIKSNGIPLDIETIKSYENISASQFLSQNEKGLGTLLIKKFADNIKYTNKGKEGQEIEFEKYLPIEMLNPVNDETNGEPGKIANVTNFEFYIRRIYPSEAYDISRLAYYAYKQTYIYDHIYYPERVRQLNQTNELMSYVAVNKANEEIIGHCANIPESFSDLCEIAVAFVNPAYRGAGCLKTISDYQIHEIQRMDFSGACGYAFTTHPYSQKAAHGLGLRESALFISRVTSLDFNKIKSTNSFRESWILMFYYFKNDNSATIFIPEKHKKMIEEIYSNLGIPNRTFAVSNEKFISANDAGVLEIKTDSYSCAHIFIKEYGRDTFLGIQHSLKTFCLNRFETIYLYMPLDCPETSGLCGDFENIGFFFCGIKPGKMNKEWLVFQYLNNQIYPYENLQFCSEFGEKLSAYVQSEDPNVNHNKILTQL